MKLRTATALLLLSPLLIFNSLHADTLQCNNKDFTLQLLGSGGPISDDSRASSGGIIWWKGKSVVLMDAGGGTFLRFGQSGAKVEDLNLLALSHFHTDHVSDVPALLKGAYFFSDPHKLKIVGPTQSGLFPSASQFISGLFNQDNGVFAYLHGLDSATDGLKLAIDVKDIDYLSETPITVYEQDGLKVTAYGIPHGDVPCLAYRFDTADGTIVVSADQNGSRKGFIEFAKGADILVMPAAIDEDADSESKYIHATPEVVGKIAAEINPKLLVLNHFMGKSLIHKSDSIDTIKKYYSGDISSSRDLSCYSMKIINEKAGIK